MDSKEARPDEGRSDESRPIGVSPSAANSRDTRPNADNDDDRLEIAPAVTEDTVRRIVKATHVIVAAAFLLVLVSLLPGIDRLLAVASLSITTVLLAVGTLVVAGALLAVAPTVETFVRQSLTGPESIVDDAAAIARYLVWFAVALIGYRGFYPLFSPAFDGFGAWWVYDAVFLLIGIVPVALIARRLYDSFDPITNLLTREVVDVVGARSDVGNGFTRGEEE